ncbi:Cof subfamily protein (haloacid dehalogenase superfamily) [Metabacillus crassostreae]|uniref:Cof-type HAD-IIB family hydrolase n=1 Tax=Metabacillus crassostreae TaxID=929098 RepID=UPI0019581C35|nr:Cof-type HAD-IIB family hydrolase [Metabacillus crassostreae]MBM7604929.1 Cof subfamily protein (haloacid dehalogenase superfamily) [Metabacillus crassostreae]
MAKLIAIDLDGTLLNSKNEISRENIDAIIRAQQSGIEIVIATGRAHFDVMNIFKQTGITTWVIAANGATIHTPKGELYHSQPIDPKTAYEILNVLENEDYYYEVFSNDYIYTPLNGREILHIEMDRLISSNPHTRIELLEHALEKQFSQTGFHFVESYKEIKQLGIDIFNILAFSFHEEKLADGWKRFGKMEDITIVSSANHNFELEHKDASKGIALKKLTKKLGIPLEDCIAIGDSMNDMSMLQIAGTSVAMGNARQKVKACSDKTTLTNDENGVAAVIIEAIKNI